VVVAAHAGICCRGEMRSWAELTVWYAGELKLFAKYMNDPMLEWLC
jgi:hypothetical protein